MNQVPWSRRRRFKFFLSGSGYTVKMNPMRIFTVFSFILNLPSQSSRTNLYLRLTTFNHPNFDRVNMFEGFKERQTVLTVRYTIPTIPSSISGMTYEPKRGAGGFKREIYDAFEHVVPVECLMNFNISALLLLLTFSFCCG